MIRHLRPIQIAVDRFFFSFSAPASAGVFRIFFGVTLLINVLLRVEHSDFYFGSAGNIPPDEALSIIPDFYRPWVSWFPDSLNGAYGFQIVMIVALVLLILGPFGRMGTRITALIVMICHLALVQRNFSIVYGADRVTSFWIFGLCFIDSAERFSVRRWLYQRRKINFVFEPEWSRILSSVGIRLVQIQLCVIYMYTGFEKLKGGDWWDQTAVWKVLGNEQLMIADFSFLRNVPLVIGLATWGTVLFEVYAPILFWPRATRKWALLAGWGLHVGIALVMGLYIFSFTMMAAYLLFVDPRVVDRVVTLASDKVRRFGQRS